MIALFRNLIVDNNYLTPRPSKIPLDPTTDSGGTYLLTAQSSYIFDSIRISGGATFGAVSGVTGITIDVALTGDSTGTFYLFDGQSLYLPSSPLFMETSLFLSSSCMFSYSLCSSHCI